MDKLKDLWSKFKVQISFVAGCLVVATSLGTCTFDPVQTSTVPEASEEVSAPTGSALSTTPVSGDNSSENSTTLEGTTKDISSDVATSDLADLVVEIDETLEDINSSVTSEAGVDVALDVTTVTE
jgi:hypothetical protein